VDVLRKLYGLDRPPLERYFSWIGGLAVGDFGISHAYHVPAANLIAERLPITLPLAALSLVIAIAVALPLGMYAATHHNRRGDFAVMAASQVGIAIPDFWFGILLVLLFSVTLSWFNAGGFPGWDDPLAALRSLLLPALALGLSQASILARVTRSAALDTLREDYVRTAWAKGLTRHRIVWGHVFRNALIPVTTIIGLQMAFLIAGTIVIENVFFLPGLGQLMLGAIANRDLIVIKDLVILITAMVVAVNLAVDLVQAAIDPRPHHG
ncbi:MAG TPA: ABC transporter permease, partial [Kiloniellales bacterium]|nr:ABC transporter permease [Kiloniellales bacterium]